VFADVYVRDPPTTPEKKGGVPTLREQGGSRGHAKKAIDSPPSSGEGLSSSLARKRERRIKVNRQIVKRKRRVFQNGKGKVSLLLSRIERLSSVHLSSWKRETPSGRASFRKSRSSQTYLGGERKMSLRSSGFLDVKGRRDRFFGGGKR